MLKHNFCRVLLHLAARTRTQISLETRVHSHMVSHRASTFPISSHQDLCCIKVTDYALVVVCEFHRNSRSCSYNTFEIRQPTVFSACLQKVTDLMDGGRMFKFGFPFTVHSNELLEMSCFTSLITFPS